MDSFEKLGVFYLGRLYDLSQRKSEDVPLLFDSKDLVTHALVIGMTGSGKTGLCFDMIEEAAIDGIPSILIDPKGDLANLLLTFPDLRPEDFAPWINEDDARKLGLSAAEYAAQQATLWRHGLAKWGQDGERIRRLREAAEFAVYTPGSTAGLPVSILRSFAAPGQAILDDPELLTERVESTVASLLGLIDIAADPVKSRETILLSTLLRHAWAQGRSLDLAGLIHEVQQPSVTRAGVLDMDSFYPPNERFELAMQLNNLLASPRFAAWMTGEPLDIGRLLHTAEGKPRVSIFSIAHLGDAERMFFVTLILNEMLGWMRAQTGANSLRALLYMDEIFGYFPPVANPPSKLPLLTLLKQARAYGVGVALATQNPVDLDYRGLANIGAWFIGRLQTERDKARVLDGLEGAAAGRGTRFDRRAMEEILAGLSSRVFLLHSVHEDAFEIFESRWAMSYLRGPLSRQQIKGLMDERRVGADAAEMSAAPEAGALGAATIQASHESQASQTSHARPSLPPQVPQYFVPARGSGGTKGALVYQPRLLGAARVRFASAKHKVDVTQDLVAATEIVESAVPVDWTAAEELSIAVQDLETTPLEGTFGAFVPAAGQVKNYAKWGRDFAAWIYGNRKLILFMSPELGLVSRADEDERDFKVRLQEAAREQRDASVEKLRRTYAPKVAVLRDRLRTAQAAQQREAEQAKRAKLDTVISFGSTLLGAFFGRKALSAGTLGKAATTMRGVTRSMDQASDVGRAADTVEAVQAKINDLDAQFRAESDGLAKSFESRAAQFETIELTPTKSNIQLQLAALVWFPYLQDAGGQLSPAF